MNTVPDRRRPPEDTDRVDLLILLVAVVVVMLLIGVLAVAYAALGTAVPVCHP